MSAILIEFPRDRSYAGRATLIDDHGAMIAGPFPAYGKADSLDASAHGNLARAASQLFGDTPCGDYRVVIAVPTGKGTPYDDHTYGPAGALILEPTGGDALEASASGRLGLMIHGGAPAANGGLRATNGCIRLSNDDMAALLSHISRDGSVGGTLLCKIVEADVSVPIQVEPESGERAGDPPPGIREFIADHGLSRRSLLKSIIAAGFTLSAAAQIPHEPPPPPPPRTEPPPEHDRESGHPPHHDRHDEPPHDRDSHDRDSHDRSHDRDAHDRDSHDRS
jgi:hypothetical protein